MKTEKDMKTEKEKCADFDSATAIAFEEENFVVYWPVQERRHEQTTWARIVIYLTNFYFSESERENRREGSKKRNRNGKNFAVDQFNCLFLLKNLWTSSPHHHHNISQSKTLMFLRMLLRCIVFIRNHVWHFFAAVPMIEILRIFNAFCYQKGHLFFFLNSWEFSASSSSDEIQQQKNSTLFMLCTLRCPRQFNVVTQCTFPTHNNHLVINCHSFVIRLSSFYGLLISTDNH
jgi:hypothetical protein